MRNLGEMNPEWCRQALKHPDPEWGPTMLRSLGIWADQTLSPEAKAEARDEIVMVMAANVLAAESREAV